jgi:predicted ATPase/DNA-binding XRE family transcriptional regulator
LTTNFAHALPTQFGDGSRSLLLHSRPRGKSCVNDAVEGKEKEAMGERASVADLLKQYRAAAGLTQEELAEKAGLSARAISDLERGLRRHPYPGTVRRLVQALELDEVKAACFQRAAQAVGGAGTALGVTSEGVGGRTSFPVQPSAFIGRQQEVKEISALLAREEVRLLTITGAGGVGKTRLAVRIAEGMAPRFSDGAVFVSLASLTDPGLVAATIAGALGVLETGEQPILDALQEALRPKQTLLVLDNFEHLLDGAPVISELITASRYLTVLVTSQAVLRLLGEYVYSVPPLRVPDLKHVPDLETLSQFEAVALFIERTKAVTPTFAMTNENALAVAEICNRLDGLPLAIELAAVRTRHIPVGTLLARLSSRLKLLTGGSRDAPGRHQTLRATVDWSHGLLNEGEKKLFARLSVFQGGCTLEAAEAICADEEDLDLDVLDGLGSLVEKSLLRQEEADDPRFLMLQTIWEYASEKLEASGEAVQVRARHAQYYLSLTEAIELELHGAEQVEWVERLERDHDNLRAALGWLLEHGDVEGELRIAAVLQKFWHQHCHFTEGRRWLEAGLALSEDISVGVRMKALGADAGLALIQGDQTHAIAVSEELLALSRAQHDPSQTLSALTILGMTAVQRGDHCQASLYLEESLSIARAQGSRVSLAHALYNLGLSKCEEGRYAAAAALIGEALALFRKTGDMFWAMNADGSLGYIALLQGRHEQARKLLVEYLETGLWIGDKAAIAAGLEGLAVAVIEEGGEEHAVRLFAAAESLRQEIGGRLMSLRNRTMIQGCVASTREHLGDEAWQVAWEEGRAMTVGQAASLAMETKARSDVAE